MKKRMFALALAAMLALSLAACGGDAPASEPASASSSVTDGGEISAEQTAMIDDYNLMVDDYNAVLGQLEQSDDLLAMEVVTSMVNQVTDSINGVTDILNQGGQLSDEKLVQLQQVIDDNREFTANLQAMVDNYAGQTVVSITMQLGNDTGADLYGVAMSPSGDESWGGNLLVEPLANGEVGSTTMNITAETLTWDLLAADAEGNTIEFRGIDFTDIDVNTGAEILLTTNESGEYIAAIA